MADQFCADQGYRGAGAARPFSLPANHIDRVRRGGELSVGLGASTCGGRPPLDCSGAAQGREVKAVVLLPAW